MTRSTSFLTRRFRVPAHSLILAILLAAGPLAAASQEFWTPADPPRSHYRIEAKVDLESHLITGRERITLKNTSRQPLDCIGIDWQITGPDSIDLKAEGRSLRLVNPQKDPPVASPLIYELPHPLPAGSEIVLEAAFQSGLLATSGAAEIKLQGWFPRLWWDGLPVSDSFEVKVNDLPGYALAASGRLDPKTGFYANKGVKTFGLYYGKGQHTDQREVDGVLVRALFTDKGAACARFCLNTAVAAIHYYKSWLGSYPFAFLSIVPGAPEPMGGYPMNSGIVVIHGEETFDPAKPGHWQFITAHEIGHQYWGEWVMDDDHPDWLWIGLGIYADRSYCEQAKVLPLRERGMIEGYMEGVEQHLDTTEDRPPEEVARIKFDYNNVVVHGKGFAIISALQTVLGKPAFESIYRSCLDTFGGRRLGWRGFERFCEEKSGRNLEWFFEEWVRTNRVLSARVKSQECVPAAGGHGFVSTVVIENQGSLRMPVPVEAAFEDGTRQRQTADRLFPAATLTFESASPLKAVVLDPEKRLANLESLPTATAQEVAERIDDADWTGVGGLALELYAQARKSDLPDRHAWFKLGLLLFDGSFYPQAFDAFQTMKAKGAQADDLFAASVWMGITQDLMGHRAEALKHYEQALDHPPTRTLQHDQYGLRIDKAWVEERLKTPFARGK